MRTIIIIMLMLMLISCTQFVVVNKKSSVITAYPNPRGDIRVLSEGSYPYPIPF